MPILICPECGAKNPLTAERCQQCSASLIDVAPSPSLDSEAIEKEGLDLFPKEEQDLPDLLNALKGDGDIETVKGEENDHPEIQETPSDAGDLGDVDTAGSQPDWLTHIRQRARQEEDASGEFTQDIEHTQQTLTGPEADSQRPDFESWIQRLRDQARDEAAGKDGQEDGTSEWQREVPEGDLEWLSKVRKAHGVLSEDDAGEDSRVEDREGDSLLQWLVELEEGDENIETISDEGQDELGASGRGVQRLQPISVKPDLDDTQEIFTDELRYEAPKLTVSDEEQIQADHLVAAIVDERASRPAREHDRRSFAWVLRLAISVLVIAGIVFALFFSSDAALPENLLQPQNEDLLAWVEALPAGSSVMIIFDYGAGYSSEIQLTAGPILEYLIQKNISLAAMSSSVSGMLLADQILDEVVPEVEDFGYVPSGALGAYDLTIGSVPPVSEYEGILILSDSYDGARAWIEQLSTLKPEASVNLLVTAQAGPLLVPYWESGQVTGMVSGVSEAAGVEAVLSEEPTLARYWRAYQVGILMMIVLLVIGMIFAVDRTANEDQGESA